MQAYKPEGINPQWEVTVIKGLQVLVFVSLGHTAQARSASVAPVYCIQDLGLLRLHYHVAVYGHHLSLPLLHQGLGSEQAAGTAGWSMHI